MQAVKINYEMILKGIEVINKLDVYYAQKNEVQIEETLHDLSKYRDVYVSMLTKYKNIYRDTYWGNFRKNVFEKNRLAQVIVNRNNFVVEFNVVKFIHCSKYPKWIHKKVYKSPTDFQYIENFDHVEVYQTANNEHVLVVSPYCKEDEYFYGLGFIKYNPMYGYHATTYVKYIHK